MAIILPCHVGFFGRAHSVFATPRGGFLLDAYFSVLARWSFSRPPIFCVFTTSSFPEAWDFCVFACVLFYMPSTFTFSRLTESFGASIDLL